jgi:hypothetical protein
MPPVLLRESLAEQRRHGVAFSIAWGRALRQALHGSTERQRWSDAIKSTRAAWEDAYLREGDTALAAFTDRTVGSGAQLCKRSTCPKSLPLGAKGYCSPDCQREGEREREAARVAMAA